jgi:hypothetical protein
LRFEIAEIIPAHTSGADGPSRSFPNAMAFRDRERAQENAPVVARELTDKRRNGRFGLAMLLTLHGDAPPLSARRRAIAALVISDCRARFIGSAHRSAWRRRLSASAQKARNFSDWRAVISGVLA